MENLDLLTRHGLFDARVPRYTSYPPANHFVNGAGARYQESWISAVPAGSDVSVYIHIPFCSRLCWFCACRTQGTKTLGPIEGYTDTLLAELAKLRKTLVPGVRMARLHLGGGTPTILPAATMHRLLTAVFDVFEPGADFEFSVEIDPTEAKPDVLQVLVDFGLNRASIGVQDFHPAVQKAIGRFQSFEQTRDVVTWLRGAKVPSLNVDLLYGLPHQTLATFEATIRQVMALYPERLAIYGYAHVPWVSKRQVMINADDLPDPIARLRLAERAKEAFVAKGFQAIGIDHFARPHDSLAFAANTGRLRRNFQGYTDDPSATLIGLGASAISRFPEGYVQNAVSTSAYQERIALSGLAGVKGFALEQTDRLIADMIEALMCHFQIDLATLCDAHPDQTAFVEGCVGGLLDRFPELLSRADNVIKLRTQAHPLIRVIAHEIDSFRSDLQAYSAAV